MRHRRAVEQRRRAVAVEQPEQQQPEQQQPEQQQPEQQPWQPQLPGDPLASTAERARGGQMAFGGQLTSSVRAVQQTI